MRSENTSFRLALFQKVDGPLSKRIELGPEGNPLSDGSECRMAEGKACNTSFEGLSGLAAILSGMKGENALALGTILGRGDGDIVSVTVKGRLSNDEDTIARTKDHLIFAEGEPGLLLIDFDQKGMPKNVADQLVELGGVWGVICDAVPALAEAGMLRRASTSAGLRNSETGETFPSSGGEHIYVAVQDASDIPRATKVLHQRLWLAGFGWIRLSAVGRLLERSIVDQSVGSPERLVFEGPPVLEPPLEQSEEARRPVVSEGLVIDTRVALPDLTPREWARYQHILEEQKRLLRPEADGVREQADGRLARELADRTGVEISIARAQIARRHRGELLPLHPLAFDDPSIGEVCVGDVLRDPERFVERTLADPLEGVQYGRCKAKLFKRRDGSLWINSFAHGGGQYVLRHDEGSLRALVEALQEGDDTDPFVTALAGAHLAKSEESVLLHEARGRSGVRVGDLRAQVGEVRQAIAARTRRASRQEQPEDPRVQLPAPAGNAELTPTLLQVDVALAAADADTPPFRTLDHRLARVSHRPISSLHQLSAEGEDPLPAPAVASIKVVDALETSMIMEEHVCFTRRRRDGREEVVRLPNPFLLQFASWERSELPRVSGITTLPLVLPGRQLKSGHGLDRDLGLIFEVHPELEAALAAVHEVSLDEAKKAYRWLCEEWLCDVEADDVGKAVLIAMALTIVERHLLPERPAFFVAAAQRGTGKTTVLNMISTAITGTMASAASWSFDEEERRKGVFSYLREGAPLVVYDNIPRGSAISCPTLERVLTSTNLTDRVLGESRSETVPTATVIAFTGNNISPKGDMASRSLVAHLATDRTDPENRDFIHEDPLAWTKAYRLEILRRLYMLLMLERAKPNKAKTRFKPWWLLIGHPVELVAGVDFEEIFRANDQYDEEAQGAAEFMALMVKYLGGLGRGLLEFTAAEVAQLCDEHRYGHGVRPADPTAPDPASLASALAEASGRGFSRGIVSSHGIARKLRSIEGRPVMVDGLKFKLVVIKDHEGNRYQIERA